MAIISVSLDGESMAMLEAVQEAYSLAGRSEAVRLSIKAAGSKVKEIEELSGFIEGVLIIVRRDHVDPWMSLIQAKYEESIKTQMHSHLLNHKCLEVMVISAEAGRIKSMLREIQSVAKADYVKFVKS
ncbi:MAG: CopG family ribbon-helix-helix protein [Candidatus Methanomethylophilaceae archaeon]|nr:CopG family transcriptional regulator, nickel-responsive regulator [Candidatus Methanomethylophilaceae archaeon]